MPASRPAFKEGMRAASFLLLTTTACTAPLRTTVTISEAELQSKVSKKFPIEKGLLIAKLALENPKVSLNATDDRVYLDVDAIARVGPVAYPGRVSVSGTLAYDQASKAIFLDDAIVHRIDLPDLPNEYREPVRTAASLALRAALEDMPVHRLKGGTERMLVKNVTVRDREVVVEVGL